MGNKVSKASETKSLDMLSSVMCQKSTQETEKVEITQQILSPSIISI